MYHWRTWLRIVHCSSLLIITIPSALLATTPFQVLFSTTELLGFSRNLMMLRSLSTSYVALYRPCDLLLPQTSICFNTNSPSKKRSREVIHTQMGQDPSKLHPSHPCVLIEVFRSLFSRLRSRSLTELTRQITPPTTNGHAPPPIESRKIFNLSILTMSGHNTGISTLQHFLCRCFPFETSVLQTLFSKHHYWWE